MRLTAFSATKVKQFADIILTHISVRILNCLTLTGVDLTNKMYKTCARQKYYKNCLEIM